MVCVPNRWFFGTFLVLVSRLRIISLRRKLLRILSVRCAKNQARIDIGLLGRIILKSLRKGLRMGQVRRLEVIGGLVCISRIVFCSSVGFFSAACSLYSWWNCFSLRLEQREH